MTNVEAPYAMKRVANLPLAEASARTKAALQEQGFGVLTEIDLQETLKKKLDVNLGAYTILGVCNPPFARRAVEAEPDIGLLLPCNVVLRSGAPGHTIIEALDPVRQLSLAERSDLEPLAVEVRDRLVRALDTAAGSMGPADRLI